MHKTEKTLSVLKTLDQTDSEADKTNNNKSQNQRIIDNSTDKRANPRNSGRNKRTNIGENSSNGSSRFGSINNLPSY